MPYKTKAAKIAAAQRRFSYIEAKNDGTFSYKDKLPRAENRGFPAQNKTGSNPTRTVRESSNSIGDKLFLKNDLIRIVLASAIIITIQIWLSLTLF